MVTDFFLCVNVLFIVKELSIMRFSSNVVSSIFKQLDFKQIRFSTIINVNDNMNCLLFFYLIINLIVKTYLDTGHS